MRLKELAFLKATSTLRFPEILPLRLFAVAGALSKSGEVRIRNVNLNPTRTGFLNVLKRAGAEVSVKVLGEKCGEPFGDISVKPSRRLKGFEIREEEVPSLIDEVPILAVLAAFCDGISRFEGLSELRVKETDRGLAPLPAISKDGSKGQSRWRCSGSGRNRNAQGL